MLVDANASVNLPSRSYLTPLAAARFRGHEEVAQVGPLSCCGRPGTSLVCTHQYPKGIETIPSRAYTS